jgi:hypothetical protein
MSPYYFERGKKVFGAYFGAAFWSNVVLQICQSEPLVRNAVISASAVIHSLHGPSQQLQEEFYQSYNGVINKTTDPTQSHWIEPLMIACSLFASCELW